MELATGLNHAEMERYLGRVGDRWPLQIAMLGGARVDDERGAPPQRERGPEFILLLVSRGFEGMPWLERVYQAGSLWDALEMGDVADVHCYTVEEFLRRRDSTPVVKRVVQRGLLLFEDSDPLYPLPPPSPADAPAPRARPGDDDEGWSAV